MRKQFYLSFLLLFLGSAIWGPALRAQSDCGKALIDAENLYQSGQLYDISATLMQCLENGFNYQQKQSAYRLLTLTYLNINQEEKAKNTLHQLLRLNPDYEIVKGKDPVELYNLYTQFNVNPVFYAGIKGGGLISRPLILNQRSSSSISGSDDKAYQMGYGFEVGLDLALPLRPLLLLELSPSYTRNSYGFEFSYFTDAYSVQPVVQKVTGSEAFNQLLLPLSLNLRIPQGARSKGKFFYNLVAGVGVSYLFASSFQDLSRLNQQIFSEEIMESKIETTGFRRQLNVQGHVGLGIEYKSMGYFWGARLGLSTSLLNNIQYESQQELYLNNMSTSFGWIDDDFVMLNGHFSVFIRKPLYKLL